MSVPEEWDAIIELIGDDHKPMLTTTEVADEMTRRGFTSDSPGDEPYPRDRARRRLLQLRDSGEVIQLDTNPVSWTTELPNP